MCGSNTLPRQFGSKQRCGKQCLECPEGKEPLSLGNPGTGWKPLGYSCGSAEGVSPSLCAILGLNPGQVTPSLSSSPLTGQTRLVGATSPHCCDDPRSALWALNGQQQVCGWKKLILGF